MDSITNKKGFLKLKNEWYKKLKDAGFNDIEKTEYKLINHQHPAPKMMAEDSPRYRQQEEYYTMARHFATNHTFASETDRFVWELHSEGIGYRSISTALSEKGITLKKSTICNVVRKYVVIMRKLRWAELSENGENIDQ